MLVVLRQIDKVVVAAVHGHCYVGAFKLTACCDLIVVGENANIRAQVLTPREPNWPAFVAAR